MTGDDTYKPASAPPFADPVSTRDALGSWGRDIAPYGIFTTDADLVIRDWNQWLTVQSGLSAEAVVGRPLADVFPDIITRRLDEHFARALRGEISVLSTALHRYLIPLPSAVRQYDTDFMLQTARIAPLPVNDQIVGTITIIEDVTEREFQAAILQRQQEFDRVLSDSLATLLRAHDPMTAMAEIFPRIAAPLKLDVYLHFRVAPEADQLELQAAGGITPEARRMMHRIIIGTTFCGQMARTRLPVVEPHVQLNPSPLAEYVRRLGLRSYIGFPLLISERVLGTLSFGSYARNEIDPSEVEFLAKLSQYVAIALDRAYREEALTEAQQRLSQHAVELEAKVMERTARLHETIGQLESFSYTIAHDLRAPIRSLNGFTEILLADYGAGLPPPAVDIVRRLQRASRRLDGLTRDLLKFSRVVREDVALAPVSLDELVEETIAITPSLQRDVLAVQRPLGCVVAQRTLLQQCLANLFDNAVKFAAPGVPPRIRIRTEEHTGFTAIPPPPPLHPPFAARAPRPRSDRRLRVWVEDNGIGIPPHALGKIWGVFERVVGASSNVEGTGIGLAIVARAVEQMGGDFGVESEVGQGSRFWLELDAAETAT